MAGGIVDAETGDMIGERTRAARRILIEAVLLGVLAARAGGPGSPRPWPSWSRSGVSDPKC